MDREQRRREVAEFLDVIARVTLGPFRYEALCRAAQKTGIVNKIKAAHDELTARRGREP